MINFCDESFLLFASCLRLLIDLENRELDQFRWTALVRRPENLLAPSFGVTKFGNAARISLTILFVEVTQCACEGSHFFWEFVGFNDLACIEWHDSYFF